MLYRKAAPTPPRLLLRIAGAGAVLGAVACSSTGAAGLVPSPVSGPPADAADQGDSDIGPVVTGLLPNPCGGGPCGSIASPPDDAGDASDAATDALRDAEVVPDDVAHCGGVCGVVIHLDQ